MKTLRFEKPRGFALQAAAEFYAGFIPGSGMAAASADGLTLAFRLDKTFEAVTDKRLNNKFCLVKAVFD